MPKISQYPSGAPLQASDKFVIARSGVNYSLTGADLGVVDGWISSAATWTYASASTFTISGDYTSVYTTGTRLKFTQSGTVKYAVVRTSSYSAPNTTVTIAVNTSYTIANSAITANYYSYAYNPPSYPDYFNFSPTWINLTVGNGTQSARYSLDGRRVTGEINLTWAAAAPTTSISGNVSFTPPVTALATDDYKAIGSVGFVDTGIALYMGECVYRSTTGNIDIRVINVAGTYATWAFISSTVPFTWGATDQLTIDFQYYV